MTVINQLVSNYLSETITVFTLCEYNGKRQVLNIPIILMCCTSATIYGTMVDDRLNHLSYHNAGYW
jgi:hypothetical protein